VPTVSSIANARDEHHIAREICTRGSAPLPGSCRWAGRRARPTCPTIIIETRERNKQIWMHGYGARARRGDRRETNTGDGRPSPSLFRSLSYASFSPLVYALVAVASRLLYFAPTRASTFQCSTPFHVDTFAPKARQSPALANAVYPPLIIHFN
jgi:hypothetical protein